MIVDSFELIVFIPNQDHSNYSFCFSFFQSHGVLN